MKKKRRVKKEHWKTLKYIVFGPCTPGGTLVKEYQNEGDNLV